MEERYQSTSRDPVLPCYLFEGEMLIKCLFTDLGLTGVPEAEKLMSATRELRTANNIPDVLLFLTHPRTVALGIRDSPACSPKDLLVSANRLKEEGIALTRSVRGGGITYHWPGQVVCYPILALRPGERDLPGYMRKLEEVGIHTLRRFGLEAARRRDSAAHLGLWVDGCKIVSMGVRVSNWITSFGFAINLNGDHSASAYVKPCGLEGVRLATIEETLGWAPSRDQVIQAIKESFVSVFGRKFERTPGCFFRRHSSQQGSADEN